MKNFVSLFLFVFFVGCSNWQTTTKDMLSRIHFGAKSISTFAEPELNYRCKKEALICKEASDFKCLKLVECQKRRDKINRGLKAVHVAVSLGYGALAIEDQELTMQRIVEGIKTFKLVLNLLDKYVVEISKEYLPWKK